MRTLAALCVACLLTGCGSEQSPRSQPQATSAPPFQKASADPDVQFLLTASAKDFHDHQPPLPTRFRDVHAGLIPAPDGKQLCLLRGQFLPKQGEWTPFATVKTSGYEQMLGFQAESYTKQPSITWDEREDLSLALKSQLDALR
jgi:hypothetical protein